LLGGDREVVVAGQHLLIAAALLGVCGRAAHDLGPPVGDVLAVVCGDGATEQGANAGGFGFDEVVEAVKPARETRLVRRPTHRSLASVPPSRQTVLHRF